MININNYKAILCLNGDLPTADFFSYYKNLPIIAADGAANKLHKNNIKPNIIIGDLDSLASLDKNIYNSAQTNNSQVIPNTSQDNNPQVIHDPNQDNNDFQKCLIYMQQTNLLPAIITGINGGCLDHILNNINIFLQTNSIIYAPPLIGFTLLPGTKTLSLPIDNKISLLGLPNALVSTQGLKWELINSQLSFPGANSCFNRIKSTSQTICVQNGALLVLVYLEKISDAGSNTL